MKTYEIISLGKDKFKVRRINLKGWGNYLIASTSLQKRLIDEEDVYKSDQAKEIDEQIFFFIPPSYFKLTDLELAKQILKSVA